MKSGNLKRKASGGKRAWFLEEESEPRTKLIFLAGKNQRPDVSVCLTEHKAGLPFLSQDESAIMSFSVLRKAMPLYEYKCTKCGSVFEILQKVNDLPLKKCIRCQGSVKKLVSPSALQFKGSGWYVTDYGSKGKQAPDPKGEDETKKDKSTTTEKKSPSSDSSSEKK